MHDALANYEPDTVVEEIDDWEETPRSRRHSEPIALGRVPTEDLIVHVRDENGHWHRRHPVKLQTSCGKPWTNWSHENRRDGRHINPPLADCECWTTAEREEAAESERLAALASKGTVL